MVRMRVGFLSAFMLFLLVFPGATMAARAEISGVDVVLHKDGAEEVRFLTRGVTPNHYFLLDHPDRLVIDLPTATATGMALPDTYKGKLIKNLRFGQFNKTHSRIVIDLAGPTAVSKFANGSPLTVTLTPTTRAAATAAVAPAPASENGSGFFGFLGGKDSATDAAASNEPCNAARNNNCVAKAPAVSKQAADKSGAAPAAAPPPPTAKPTLRR